MKLGVYWQYMRALHTGLVLLYVVILMASYGVTILSNVWISKWTDDPLFSNDTVNTSSATYINTRNYYLETYSGIGVAEGGYHCTVCVPVYSVGTSVQCGYHCTVWVPLYSGGASVHYGYNCTVWVPMYSVGTIVQCGYQCTVWVPVYSVGIIVQCGYQCTV